MRLQHQPEPAPPCPATSAGAAAPPRRRIVAGAVGALTLGTSALAGALAPSSGSATPGLSAPPALVARTLGTILPAPRQAARPGTLRRAARPAASISRLRYATGGGRLVVRLTDMPADSTCSFSAGAGVKAYSGHWACSGLFVHAGRVDPNPLPAARRWTVRAQITTGAVQHRFAWVISIAGRPPLPPATPTTAPPTAPSTTAPATTSTLPSTTTPATPPGGQPGAESTNWSGYSHQLSLGAVTEVGATWTVPTLDCSVTPNGEDAEWVGVDGTGGGEQLFQAGVDSACQNGQQVSSAWYEDIEGNPPAPSVPLDSIDVSPGDTVSATVSQYSASSWQYSVTDLTTGQTAAGIQPYTGPLSSADWIEEDPSIEGGGGSVSLSPYAAFGVVDFSGLTLNEATPALDITNDGIEIVQHGAVLALPSQAVGGSFDVTYQG